jgi:copper chaperone CopZ
MTMAKKTFHILDMHCPNCAMTLEGLEDDLPGVQSVSASYAKGEMLVEFDERRVSEAEIVSAVEKLGYHPRTA